MKGNNLQQLQYSHSLQTIRQTWDKWWALVGLRLYGYIGHAHNLYDSNTLINAFQYKCHLILTKMIVLNDIRHGIVDPTIRLTNQSIPWHQTLQLSWCQYNITFELATVLFDVVGLCQMLQFECYSTENSSITSWSLSETITYHSLELILEFLISG